MHRTRVAWNRMGLLGIALVLACRGSDSTGPEVVWQLRPGVIHFFDEPIGIESPESTAVGAGTTIRIETYGGGCTAEGPTKFSVSGLTATVQPLDSVIRPHPDLVCTDELRVFEHQAVLEFEVAGVAAVRVVGRREPGGEEVEFERTIVVR